MIFLLVQRFGRTDWNNEARFHNAVGGSKLLAASKTRHDWQKKKSEAGRIQKRKKAIIINEARRKNWLCNLNDDSTVCRVRLGSRSSRNVVAAGDSL